MKRRNFFRKSIAGAISVSILPFSAGANAGFGEPGAVVFVQSNPKGKVHIKTVSDKLQGENNALIIE